MGKLAVLTLFGAALVGLRFLGVTHPAFQAVAHVFVGGLFVAGWWGWRGEMKWETLREPRTVLALGMSLAETVAALRARGVL